MDILNENEALLKMLKGVYTFFSRLLFIQD